MRRIWRGMGRKGKGRRKVSVEMRRRRFEMREDREDGEGR